MDSQDVERLARAARVLPKTSDPLVVAEDLEDVVLNVIFEMQHRKWPRAHEARRSLSVMHSTSKKMLRAWKDLGELGVDLLAPYWAPRRPDGYYFPPRGELHPGAEQRVLAAIDTLADMSAWLGKALNDRTPPLKHAKRHHGDLVLQTLISGLASVWQKHWQRSAGVSTSAKTERLGGPFVRFVQCFLLLANPHLEHELRINAQQVRDQLRRVRKEGKGKIRLK